MSDFVCPDGARLIPLYGKKGNGLFAIVDSEDYDRLIVHKWVTCSGYAMRYETQQGKRLHVFLHHEIIGRFPGLVTDHINGNPLDDRSANLRIVTQSENMLNRKMARNNKTGFKGVHPATQWGITRYRACISLQGKKYHLGTFLTPEEASQAYIQASQKLHGEFSRSS